METAGAMHALKKFAAAGHPVPAFAVVRGASNYDQNPMVRAADGVSWEQSTEGYADAKAFNIAGYHFAVQTSNAVVMNYLDAY